MVDHISEERRSWNMSRIRSKDTKPEMIVRKMLHQNGISYRLHVKDLPGKPDLSNKKKKFAVFINGCFWHQHQGCKRATMPKSNTLYWKPKLKRNIEKFNENVEKLLLNGWRVFTIWECEVQDQKILKKLVTDIYKI